MNSFCLLFYSYFFSRHLRVGNKQPNTSNRKLILLCHDSGYIRKNLTTTGIGSLAVASVFLSQLASNSCNIKKKREKQLDPNSCNI